MTDEKTKELIEDLKLNLNTLHVELKKDFDWAGKKSYGVAFRTGYIQALEKVVTILEDHLRYGE